MNKLNLKLSRPGVGAKRRWSFCHSDLLHNRGRFASVSLADFSGIRIQSHSKAPDEVVLDVDGTDDPLYGNQEGRFFHGYYAEYCYLPLYIFSGEHLLCARLRQANEDPASGVRRELERIVQKLRGRCGPR